MSQETAKFHPVTHVIFDSDGLLIDSEKYYTEALVETAKKHGKVFTNEIKVAMMGKYAYRYCFHNISSSLALEQQPPES